MKIKTVPRLIDALGGPNLVARELRILGADISSQSTVSRWSKVGGIPANWWRKIIVIGEKAGLNLDVEKMLTLSEGDEIDV